MSEKWTYNSAFCPSVTKYFIWIIIVIDLQLYFRRLYLLTIRTNEMFVYASHEKDLIYCEKILIMWFNKWKPKTQIKMGIRSFEYDSKHKQIGLTSLNLIWIGLHTRIKSSCWVLQISILNIHTHNLFCSLNNPFVCVWLYSCTGKCSCSGTCRAYMTISAPRQSPSLAGKHGKNHNHSIPAWNEKKYLNHTWTYQKAQVSLHVIIEVILKENSPSGWNVMRKTSPWFVGGSTKRKKMYHNLKHSKIKDIIK